MSGDSLRVVMLVGDSPRDGRMAGGVASASSYLARALRASGGIEVVEVDANDAWRDRERAQWTERVRNGAHAPAGTTLVHAHGVAEPAWLAARSRLPFVVTVHGLPGREVRYEPGVRERWRRWRSERLARAALSDTHDMIAITDYAADHYRRLLPDDCRVHRIANAVDPAFFGISPIDRTTRSPDAPTILFAGRLTPRKRPLDLIRALTRVHAQIPRASLRLAGADTGSGHRAELEREVRRLGLGKAVTFTGLLDEGEIAREFDRADVVCLPSAQETAPMSVAQALAAGRPVVATRVGGVEEMVGRDAGVLVSPGDVDALAGALLRVLLDPARADTMAAAGRRRALVEHEPASVARRTIEVYRAVAHGERT